MSVITATAVEQPVERFNGVCTSLPENEVFDGIFQDLFMLFRPLSAIYGLSQPRGPYSRILPRAGLIAASAARLPVLLLAGGDYP